MTQIKGSSQKDILLRGIQAHHWKRLAAASVTVTQEKAQVGPGWYHFFFAIILTGSYTTQTSNTLKSLLKTHILN